MTAGNSSRCISRTITKYEGTTLDLDPRDRGNWTSGKIGVGQLKGTKFGIAAFVYPDLDIANLTLEDAVAIYRRDYWPKVFGDTLPVGVDLTAWDACVNSGASRAIKWLAGALTPPLESIHTTAARLAQYAVVAVDKVDVIKKANAARRSFLIGLHNATYQKGWLRRVADVEATSISWFLQTIKPADEVKSDLAKEAGLADISSVNNKAGASATGAGTAAAGTHAAASTWDWPALIECGLVVCLVVATAYLAYKHFVEKNRAAAFREAASTVGG